MRKIIPLLLAFTISVNMFAQETQETVKSISETSKTLQQVSETVAKADYTDAKKATAVVYEDSKSLITQIYEDGKSMAPDLKAAFKTLADSFNTTVERLWDILVKQQYVWSIAHAILLIVTITAWYNVAKMIKKTSSDLTETKEMKAINIIYTILLLVVALYGTTHSVDNLDRMLTGFVNPEFGAVRTIVEFIQK